LARLREVSGAVPVPVIAIGGIDAARAASVREAGAAMWAAISAVCSAPSPFEAARELGR
jgi:thiamine-phosphate pyrophosphorylase